MSTLLCTQTDLETELSYLGVRNFGDLDNSGLEDSAVIASCISRASAEVIGELFPRYTVANLATSDLVTKWTAVIACFYLCKKRGNQAPESLYEEYEQITARPDGFLARTKAGAFMLEGVKQTGIGIPSFDNLTIDRRYRREKIRVTEGNSSTLTRSPLETDRAPELAQD